MYLQEVAGRHDWPPRSPPSRAAWICTSPTGPCAVQCGQASPSSPDTTVPTQVCDAVDIKADVSQNSQGGLIAEVSPHSMSRAYQCIIKACLWHTRPAFKMAV